MFSLPGWPLAEDEDLAAAAAEACDKDETGADCACRAYQSHAYIW